MTSDFPCQFWWDQHFRTQQYEEHSSPFKIKKMAVHETDNYWIIRNDSEKI